MDQDTINKLLEAQDEPILPVEYKPQAVRNQARITVTLRISHQSDDAQPFQAEYPWSRLLRSDEEPYRRRARVSTEWQPLDLGWLKDQMVGMIVIHHETERQPTVLPEEQRKALASRLVEVGLELPTEDDDPRDMHSPPAEGPLVVPLLYLPPGEAQPLCLPAAPGRLRLRCQAGPVRCTVVVVPA